MTNTEETQESYGRGLARAIYNKKGAFPILVFEDRYGGAYSGGAWIAVADFGEEVKDGKTRFQWVLDGAHDGDLEAGAFWDAIIVLPWVAVGDTPNDAVKHLLETLPDRPEEV